MHIAINVNNICFNPLNTPWKATVPGKILKFWNFRGTKKLVIMNKIEKLNLADGLCCASFIYPVFVLVLVSGDRE
jgi:hypothetical protein